MEFNELVKHWRTWQQAQSFSARTVDERTITLTAFARWANVDPVSADTAAIVSWLAEGGDWVASTRATYYSHLRQWFTWLVLFNHRLDDPMIRVKPPRVPRSEPHPIADENFLRLMKASMRVKTRIMILLMAYAGLRCHEVAKFRGEHIDLEARTLTVKGKGGVTEVLPLHPELAKVARTVMPRRGYWFPANTKGSGSVRPGSVSKVVGMAMRRADVPGAAHDLRHWFGTTLSEEGVETVVTQKLLRHGSLQTTQRYVAVRDQRRRDGIETLDIYRAATPTTDDDAA